MDEKRPPRVPGPAPFQDTAIMCISLRGTNRDRVSAFASLKMESKRTELDRAADTLAQLAQQVLSAKGFAPFRIQIVLLRDPKMKVMVDEAAAKASALVPKAPVHTSDLRIGGGENRPRKDVGRKLTGKEDTGAQSAALIWTACCLSERMFPASALIIPRQITWRQLLGIDPLHVCTDDAPSVLCQLFQQTKGLAELRSAFWSDAGSRDCARVRFWDGSAGICQRHRSDADPRVGLVAFRANASISLLQQVARVDSPATMKDSKAHHERPLSRVAQFGDGLWPIGTSASAAPGTRNHVNCDFQGIHRAGLALDPNMGHFGLGAEPIHVIVPVHAHDCAAHAARWVVKCLDSQSVWARIVAHPVLMRAAAPTDGKEVDAWNREIEIAREAFGRELRASRGRIHAAGGSKDGPRRFVRVLGIMNSDIRDSAQSAACASARFEPSHFAYARDVLRNSESVDYVVFAGTEFESVRAGWVEALWRRREPGCGAAWFGRMYKSCGGKDDSSRGGGDPRRELECETSTAVRAIADAANTARSLLQVQGRIMRTHTAFHAAAFRAGSVVDARVFDDDSDLWEALRSIESVVGDCTQAALAPPAFESDSPSTRRPPRPHPSPRQVAAEVQLATADIALSYVLRPFRRVALKSSSDPALYTSRIARAFAAPVVVRRSYAPAGSATAYMRAESLHLTDPRRGNASLLHKRPSTMTVWRAEESACRELQRLDPSWKEYLRNVVPRRGESLDYSILDPICRKKDHEARRLAGADREGSERTLIVYYEDATGCGPSVLRFGNDIPAPDRAVRVRCAMAFGGANQVPLIRTFADATSRGVEVRVMAPDSASADAARARLQTEAESIAADNQQLVFSSEGVPSLRGASYFGAWLEAARATLAHITALYQENDQPHRHPTRVIMLRSVPLWGSTRMRAYMMSHVRHYYDVGVSDAGIMPFSEGVDFSVLGCRPWFLRAAVEWATLHPNLIQRASHGPVDARRVFKEMMHDLHTPLALWPLPYTYPVWRVENCTQHSGKAPQDAADVAPPRSQSRTLIPIPYVQRRGTNIISPFFPSIRFRWRAMFSSDRIR